MIPLSTIVSPPIIIFILRQSHEIYIKLSLLDVRMTSRLRKCVCKPMRRFNILRYYKTVQKLQFQDYERNSKEEKIIRLIISQLLNY